MDPRSSSPTMRATKTKALAKIPVPESHAPSSATSTRHMTRCRRGRAHAIVERERRQKTVHSRSQVATCPGRIWERAPRCRDLTRKPTPERCGDGVALIPDSTAHGHDARKERPTRSRRAQCKQGKQRGFLGPSLQDTKDGSLQQTSALHIRSRENSVTVYINRYATFSTLRPTNHERCWPPRHQVCNEPRKIR